MTTRSLTLTVKKKVLRKSVTSTLQGIPTLGIQTQCECPHQLLRNELTILGTAQAIAARILTSPFFRDCKCVSCYLSMPSAEVDTASVILEILRTGKFWVIASTCVF
jgi:5-formyltetrahydrofolate cyclo-ligase